MDGIRAAMGDKKLNYFGFSYGTFLGATYASLFPDNYRAMVLDGPVDANSYINTPSADLREQTAGFERALGRFFQACAVDQAFCKFGGDDPWAAYDALVEQANLLADPGARLHRDPRPVNGDDILNGTLITLYAKQQLVAAWPTRCPRPPRRRRVRRSASWPTRPGATTSTARSTRAPTATSRSARSSRTTRPTSQTFLDAGDNSWGMFDHFWFNTGYAELNYGALADPREGRRSTGPFTASKSAPTMLEVATTYDPATPYRGAKRLATQLGNVRFLTMVGDGHTAYRNGNSACIDACGRRADRDADAAARRAPSASRTCRSCRRRRRCCGDSLLAGGTAGAARCCGSARTASTRRRTRWVRFTRHPARTPRAHTRAACGHAARAGAGRARVARARVAPGGLVPGRRDLGIEDAGRAAPRDRPPRAGTRPARRSRGRRSSRRPPGRCRCAGSRARASRWRGRRRRA